MGTEAGHVQLTEITRESIPSLNWMMEDLFCRYGVSIPYFLLDFSFADYSDRPDYVTYTPPDWYLPEWKAQWPSYETQWGFPEFSGFNFNVQWEPWDYWLPWFNELIGLLFDEADLPRWQMPDFSPSSIDMLNTQISALYLEAGWTEISAENEDNYQVRAGDGATYAAAKTDYQNAPTWYAPGNSGHDLLSSWDTYHYPGAGEPYDVKGRMHYLKFDTSAWSGVARAKFSLSSMTIFQREWADNPVLQIYEHNYNEPFGSSDWTGGTKIAEQEIPASDTTAEIEFDPARITFGGNSKYRFTLKATTDEDFFPTGPDDDDYKALYIRATTVKLLVQ